MVFLLTVFLKRESTGLFCVERLRLNCCLRLVCIGLNFDSVPVKLDVRCICTFPD